MPPRSSASGRKGSSDGRGDHTPRGAVGTLLFSNPAKKNAMTYDMWRAVAGALAKLDADPAVRVIVVAGAKKRAFISGADISQFGKLRGTAYAQAEYHQAVEAASVAPMICARPVVARIRGFCIGGGLGFAAACDLRLCSQEATFRMPAAELERAVGEYCAGIAENAPLSIAAAKFAAQQWLKDPAERDLARAQKLIEACLASADYKEGRAAFLEKRAPRFTGR